MVQQETLPPITLTTLREMKRVGEKIACLTAYDATFARVLEGAGVEVLLVGDSLGMVIQGWDTTLPVSVADMVYHSACVARARTRALVMVDMPFMSDISVAQAVGNAGRLMKEGGAHVVKVEVTGARADVVEGMSRAGIPVCAHLGLLPQSVHKLGGYRVQGRGPDAGERLYDDARTLARAGADLLLLECVPASLAERITHAVAVPVIGIGAGAACDGQVLVLHDMLGVTPGRRPRFSKDFLVGVSGGIDAAVRAYVRAVKEVEFPDRTQAFD